MFTYIVLAPLVLFAAIRSVRLVKNYYTARQFGLPIILLPVSFEDIWWIPLRPLFSWVERLPFGLGNWYMYTDMGWPTIDGNRSVLRFGENFVLCSPAGIQIATAYGPGLEHVLKNHKTWPQPGAQSQLFTFYGQNVTSTNGAEWQRHRKITATAFNENSMREVWSDAIERTKQLDLPTKRDRSLKEIRSTFDLLAMVRIRELPVILLDES